MVAVEFDDDFSDLDPGDVTTAPPISRSRGTGRKPGTPRRASAKKVSDLQQSLSGQMFQAGTMIGFGLPVTGYFICQESDNFTRAVTRLAAKNPTWVKALEQIADIQPGITIGRVVLGLGVALSVDRNPNALDARSPRFQRFAAFMGVAAAYNAVYGSDNGEGGGAGVYANPPPNRFEPIT